MIFPSLFAETTLIPGAETNVPLLSLTSGPRELLGHILAFFSASLAATETTLYAFEGSSIIPALLPGATKTSDQGFSEVHKSITLLLSV